MKNCWDVIADLLSKRIFPDAIHRTLLTGPPGTGKSHAIRALTRDYENVTLFPTQFTDYVLGSMGLQNGNTVCNHGPIAIAARDGKPIVIDEIDAYSPDVRTVLHSALDDFDQCRLTMPDGSKIKPTPGYCVIATTNANPSSLPDALLDRFDLILQVNSPAPGLLETMEPSVAKVTERWYADTYPNQSVYWTPPQVKNMARSALRFTRLLRAGLDREYASELVWGNQAASFNAAMATVE